MSSGLSELDDLMADLQELSNGIERTLNSPDLKESPQRRPAQPEPSLPAPQASAPVPPSIVPSIPRTSPVLPAVPPPALPASRPVDRATMQKTMSAEPSGTVGSASMPLPRLSSAPSDAALRMAANKASLPAPINIPAPIPVPSPVQQATSVPSPLLSSTSFSSTTQLSSPGQYAGSPQYTGTPMSRFPQPPLMTQFAGSSSGSFAYAGDTLLQGVEPMQPPPQYAPPTQFPPQAQYAPQTQFASQTQYAPQTQFSPQTQFPPQQFSQQQYMQQQQQQQQQMQQQQYFQPPGQFANSMASMGVRQASTSSMPALNASSPQQHTPPTRTASSASFSRSPSANGGIIFGNVGSDFGLGTAPRPIGMPAQDFEYTPLSLLPPFPASAWNISNPLPRNDYIVPIGSTAGDQYAAQPQHAPMARAASVASIGGSGGASQMPAGLEGVYARISSVHHQRPGQQLGRPGGFSPMGGAAAAAAAQSPQRATLNRQAAADIVATYANSPKTLMEISTIDNSTQKRIEVAVDMLGSELLQVVLSKLKIAGAGTEMLGLAIPGRSGQSDRWVEGSLQVNQQDLGGSLVLKVRYFKTPKSLDDPGFVNLMWIQVQPSILSGQYPVSDYLAVRLAALNLQVLYGDRDPKLHTTGFFKDSRELQRFLPAYYATRFSPQYWERRLFIQHSHYTGFSTVQAQLEYLRFAKKSPAYGVHMYEITSGADAVFGVAEDGLLLCRKKHEASCGDWSYYSFDRISSIAQTSTGLQFVYGRAADGRSVPETFSFSMYETSAIIALQTARDYLQMYKLFFDASAPADIPYLPPVDEFMQPLRRVMLTNFPSQLELFKEVYISESNNLNKLVSLVVDRVDRELDNGNNCDTFSLEGLNFDDDQFKAVRNALIATFSFTPTPGYTYVHNFVCREFIISGNPRLSAASIESLHQLFSLQSFPVKLLDVSNNPTWTSDHTAALVTVVATAANLAHLDVSNVPLSHKASVDLCNRGIRHNGMIKSVNLSNTGIHDSFCIALGLTMGTHSSLEAVNVSMNGLTDEGGKQLALGLKSGRFMTSINLNHTKVKAKTIKQILEVAAKKGKPHRIEMAHVPLSSEVVELLCETLQRSGAAGVYRVLDMHATQLKTKSVNMIFSALTTNATLTSLSIGGNGVDKTSLSVLQSALRNNSSLQTLSLKSLDCGSDGYAFLGDILRTNTSIQNLDISSSIMNSADVRRLFDSLQHNKTLLRFNCAVVKVGSDGAAHAMKVFASNLNSTLIWLNLDAWNLQDAGARVVAEALSQNRSLQTVSLRDNGIGNSGAQAILEALGKNKTLKKVNLEKNSTNLAGDAELQELRAKVSGGMKRVYLDDDLPAAPMVNKNPHDPKYRSVRR